MPQLSIQIAGKPEQRIRIDDPCTIACAGREVIAVPELGDAVLSVTPLASGLVVESTVPFEVGPRRIGAGLPRLLRNGERATLAGVTLTAVADPAPEGTRELAAAMLAGLDPTPIEGPSVLVLEGLGAGRRFPMGPTTVIGRGADAGVALTDPLVSRRHVRLHRSGSAIVAHHVHSKNGLVVNGRRRWRRHIPLRSGDELRVGETLLLVEDPASSEAPAKRLSAGAVRRPTAEIVSVAFASAALLAAALLLLRAAG